MKKLIDDYKILYLNDININLNNQIEKQLTEYFKNKININRSNIGELLNIKTWIKDLIDCYKKYCLIDIDRILDKIILSLEH